MHGHETRHVGRWIGRAIGIAAVALEVRAQSPWPELRPEHRPWAYNWWLGSAVDTTNLVRELRRYHEGGLGGIHVVPIYGARGAESRFVPYLTEPWLELMECAIREAAQLGMKVDLSTGTGWCFGGPWVAESNGVARWVVSDRGLRAAWTGLKVKRAAPGGEGPMINPFSPAAMRSYLEEFDRRVGPRLRSLRAMYHDSFEYFGATWAPELPDRWRRRYGVPVEQELEALQGRGDPDRVRRVAYDYRRILSDLVVDEVFPMWVDWARRHGWSTRLQAHGAPANLLDLYALADIPETEMFGRGTRDPLVSGFGPNFTDGDRNVLVAKFASSAAHLAGRSQVAAETGTWMAEHFCETLEELKCLVDLLWVAGVNHVIYHGCVYSPDDAPWPGWLFYAATQLNPRNPLWREVRSLNEYVARGQALLQAGVPDADLLVYWPFDDLLMSPLPSGHPAAPIPLAIHDPTWFTRQPVGTTAGELWRRGIAFDYVSDRALSRLRVGPDGRVRTTEGACWRAIWVPPCEFMAPETLEELIRLAREGATVVWEDRQPADVPGWGTLEERRQKLAAVRERRPETGPRWQLGPMARLLQLLELPGTSPTPEHGLYTVRRRLDDGYVVLLVWHGLRPLCEPIALPLTAARIQVLDPLTGEHGWARCAATHPVSLRLDMDPAQSLILRTYDQGDAPVQPTWPRFESLGAASTLTGTWHVTFLEGGPEQPRDWVTDRLVSWTESGDPAAVTWAGTARYQLDWVFQGLDGLEPSASKDWNAEVWRLDLGDVRHVARVRLDGRDLGVRFMRPYRWIVPAEFLQPGPHRIEVEVTNLAANRIRDMDRRRIPWKIFYDINFVNIRYKPFDASDWPVFPSGLLGPVTLTPGRKTF